MSGRTGWKAAVSAVVVAAVTATGQAALAAPEPAAVSQATITVGTQASGRLPSDFIGLSYEMRELSMGSFDASRGNLVAVYRTLGRNSSNIRISGNTLDRDTLWIPAGEQAPSPLPEWVANTVGPADISRLNAFLVATGWRSEVGINVGRWDARLGANQAQSMSTILGQRLTAIECGNEPDQWVSRGYRPAGYAYADYLQDWRRCAAVAGSKKLAGPDAASPTSSWAASLARDEKARLAMLVTHQYSMAATGTAEQLLSPATASAQLSSVTPNLNAAKAQGLPFRIDETNSAFGGGVEGVSDTYASALWAFDYTMQMAKAGAGGVNLHGGLGVCGAPLFNGRFQRYTPICAANTADEQAKIYKAMPEFYGIYLTSRMGPGAFLPVTLSTNRNVTAYAVRGDDGMTRLAVIQKDATTTEAVHLDITVGGPNRTADILRLTGTSLSSPDAKIQGATLDRAGQLRPGRADQAQIRAGKLGVDLAGGSAVLITLGC
jgi:hypothetical protein